MKHNNLFDDANRNFEAWSREIVGNKPYREVNRSNVLFFYNMDKEGDNKIVWHDPMFDSYHSYRSLAAYATEYFSIDEDRALAILHQIGAAFDAPSTIAIMREKLREEK